MIASRISCQRHIAAALQTSAAVLVSIAPLTCAIPDALTPPPLPPVVIPPAPTPTADAAPKIARTAAPPIESIFAGREVTCALLLDKTVRCWGSNTSGTLGTGQPEDAHSPIKVAGIADAVALFGGEDHLFARSTDGTVRSWGNNDHGELGEGTTDDRRSPTEIPWLKGVPLIAPGKWHTCILTEDDLVRCWGYQSNGELGRGPSTRDAKTPVTVPVAHHIKDLVSGSGHSCARFTEGTLACWGSGSDGQLGSGRQLSKPPTLVPKLQDAIEVAAGGYHTCALVKSGTVSCWGRNADGQVGDGTTDDRYFPTEVKGLRDVKHIRARFLNRISEAYAADPRLKNLLLAPYFSAAIGQAQGPWRRVVAQAVKRHPGPRVRVGARLLRRLPARTQPRQPDPRLARLFRRPHLPAHRRIRLVPHALGARRRASHGLDVPGDLTLTRSAGRRSD